MEKSLLCHDMFKLIHFINHLISVDQYVKKLLNSTVVIARAENN